MLSVGLPVHLMRTSNRKVLELAISCAEEYLRDSLRRIEIGLILAKLHTEQAVPYRDGHKLVSAL